MDLVLFSV